MLYNTDEDHCLACQVGAFWNNSIQTLYVCRVGSYGIAGPPAMDQGGHPTSGYITIEHLATCLYLPIVYTGIEPVSTKP